ERDRADARAVGRSEAARRDRHRRPFPVEVAEAAAGHAVGERHRLAADEAREAPRVREADVRRGLLRGAVDRTVAVQAGGEDESIGVGLAHGYETAGSRIPPGAPDVEGE